jgi:Tfp pilus assembly protein PilO
MDDSDARGTVNVSKAGATKIVGGIALLAVVAVGWAFVLSPRSSALAEVHQQIDEVKTRNGALQQQIDILRTQEAALGEVRETAEALAAKFPPTADQPGLFREVTRAAIGAGIPATKVTALTPQAPTVGNPGRPTAVKLPGESTTADLAKQTVTISVEGRWDQLQRLMRNLEQMSRAYLVTSVTVGQGSSAGLYNATITGETFVMPGAPDPARAATPAPTVPPTDAPRPVGASSTPEPSATS